MFPLPDFPRIFDYAFHYAVAAPEREALVLNDRRVTYGGLAEDVRRCAIGLLALGVAHGERVAMLSTPRPEAFVTFLAATSIGAIWVGLNPRYTREELRYVIADSRPKVMFSICAFEQRDYAEDLTDLAQEFAGTLRVVTLDRALDGYPTYSGFLGQSHTSRDRLADERQSAVEASDAAAILYTSGSTGGSKGVILTHRALLFGYHIQFEHWTASPLRTLNNLPINHISGLGDLSIFPLIAGGTIVYMERFNADLALELIEHEKITFLQQFPTQFQRLIDAPGFREANLSSLQVIAWGGAAMPTNIIARLQETGARLYNSYGMTECGAPVVFTDDGASIETLANTVGRLDPRFKLQLVDANGDPCAPDQAGEIQIGGDTLMIGYWNKPEQTADALSKDGWLRTADLGLYRPDGNLQLVGRLKDMFKSGGYSIYPREIEIVLERHRSVEMAVVVPVPDPLFQEVGHAFVLSNQELAPGALDDHCRAILANYKVPKRFHVVSELPMLSNGKVDRKVLMARAIDALQ